MINYFIIPGYGGSGPDHWQTYFENSQKNFQRILQKDWNNPNIDEWAKTIEEAVAVYDPESVILVAHSLGCHTVAQWARHYNKKIKGALLVAPPDIEAIQANFNVKLFEQFSIDKINFQTIVVASTNDPWASIEKAEFYAGRWGSKIINIGAAGHINDLSGHYDWKQGLEILRSFS